MGLFGLFKKGKEPVAVQWIQKTHLFKADEYICSRCGAAYSKPYKVCPNCQSVMGRSKYDPPRTDETAGLFPPPDDEWLLYRKDRKTAKEVKTWLTAN